MVKLRGSFHMDKHLRNSRPTSCEIMNEGICTSTISYTFIAWKSIIYKPDIAYYFYTTICHERLKKTTNLELG